MGTTKRKNSSAIRILILVTILAVGIGTVRGRAWIDRQRIAGNLAPAKGTWCLTQYPGTSGNQSMFYSVTNADNQLVLIDGGWNTPSDVQQVLHVIRQHNNHVNAWIITHAHPDHVGAFIAILSDPSLGVTVDQIYTPHVNRERYIETAHDYDGIDSFYEFEQLTAGLDNVTELEENDTLELLGLDWRVLHAWDAHVEAQEANLLNHGSLMFAVSGKEQRVLFCSDVQSEMEQFIEEGHRAELSADYVQCGHHGNWGLSTDFYTIVDAEHAFVDAPAYIREDTTGRFDCPQLLAYFQERGTEILTWDVARNVVFFH